MMAQYYSPITSHCKSIMFEEILDEYRRCGCSLRRTTPQPTQRNSYEEQIASVLCRQSLLLRNTIAEK